MVMVEQQFMGWIIEFGLEVFGFFEPWINWRKAELAFEEVNNARRLW
jgi:hypothetical protein